MSTKKQYEYVPLDDSNIHLLVGLYKKVFNTNYTLDEIKAKYQSDYSGICAQGHFAFFEGKAVAFHGAIPVLMKHKDKIELCAQYGDAMTLKEHAGNGLFTKLGLLTDDLLKELGVKFFWGFPNQNSEYGYVNKLAWKGNERMQCYIFKINAVSSEMLFRKTKIWEQKKQEQIKTKLAKILVEKENLHSIDTNIHGGIDRSAAFYKYKSFSPNYFICLKETKVWIKPKGGLLVGDMEVESEIQVLDIVSELKKLAKNLGLHKVVIQVSPRSKLNQILSSRFAAIDSWLIGYKDHDSEFPLEDLQFTYGDLDTF